MTVLQQSKNQSLNATVYVDYENIFELLKKYGVTPMEINFFPVIMTKFRNDYKLNIIECIVYCNFEKKPFQGNQQTILQNLGLQTRHSAINGKNCSDLALTVDALTALHKYPNINVFVIVSSDRDMIPLLKAIKYENKFTYVLSTMNGFNPIVSCYADYHEYLEDIFNLTSDMDINPEAEKLDIEIQEMDLNFKNIAQAKEVAKLLYDSNVWRRFETEGEPVTLKGYLNIVTKKIGRPASQIEKDFQLAHYLKYLIIYQDQHKVLCIKRGDQYTKIIDS